MSEEEDTMQNIDANSEPITPQPPLPGNAKDWRPLSDLLHLWALCHRSACRKAGACHGDSRDCVPRCSPIVPEDVRVWVTALMECKNDGLSFDDARASLPPGLEEAWKTWSEAVLRIADRRVRRGSPP
jgi:hypothetical protein